MTLAQLRRRFKSEGYELKSKVESEDTFEVYSNEEKGIVVAVERKQGKLISINVKDTKTDKVIYSGDNLDKAKYQMRKLEEKE